MTDDFDELKKQAAEKFIDGVNYDEIGLCNTKIAFVDGADWAKEYFKKEITALRSNNKLLTDEKFSLMEELATLREQNGKLKEMLLRDINEI